jgi:hypothetical protein
MSDLGTFSSAAKGLARNPLGIIALFIVLIYGFAALTLGFNSFLQPAERLPLVWFLVIFPLIVLFTFAWLVSKHHEKLYAPGDFKTDDGFAEGVRAKVRHVEDVHAQQDQLKSKVRETLISTISKIDKLNQDINSVVEKVEFELDQASNVTVDARDFLKDSKALFTFPVAALESLSDLTNSVYFKLAPAVKPYEYGHSWILRNTGTGEVVRNARMITLTVPGRPLTDTRALDEVGIKAGMTLTVEHPFRTS